MTVTLSMVIKSKIMHQNGASYRGQGQPFMGIFSGKYWQNSVHSHLGTDFIIMTSWQEWWYLSNHQWDHCVSHIKQKCPCQLNRKKTACQYLHWYGNGKTSKTGHKKNKKTRYFKEEGRKLWFIKVIISHLNAINSIKDRPGKNVNFIPSCIKFYPRYPN